MTPVMMPVIERSFVTLSCGLVHVAVCGAGRPVLLLHQTPRSWDEFREVLPLLGGKYRAIAMDTVGFGDSRPLPAGEDSIERWAAVAHELLAKLGHSSAVVVGHHTGAAIAVEMAAMHPERVEALVLSASPYVDAARRLAAPGKPVIDEVAAAADGRHLLELWAMRQPFYPAERPDLLERFVADALKAGPRAAEGHRVVGRYVMEPRLAAVRCPTLVIAPTADPHAYPHAGKVASAIAGSRLVEIAGGMVPLPDQMPQAFARAVDDFLSHGASPARRDRGNP
ncbi:MAG: alpha/beta hydrolase [Alphaproteobacteria bacterium]|nr:alpha/beta hydrolase [Alphaproteobacteria bacterium]